MADSSFLTWPFFEDRHRDHARDLSAWCETHADGLDRYRYVTDKQAYLRDARRIGEIYRSIMGRVFPVMAVVQVVALMEDAALIEIETTAIVPAEGEW